MLVIGKVTDEEAPTNNYYYCFKFRVILPIFTALLTSVK